MAARVLFLGRPDSPVYEYLRSIHDEVSATDAPLDLAALERDPPDWIVSHGYRHIVPAAAIQRFRDRMVNLHISLLPWNRGADPNLWSFVDGTPSGVTIHYMDEGVDTGDVIAQRELRFGDEETLATTYASLQEAIASLFREVWPLLLDGNAPRRPQSGAHTYHRVADRQRIAALLTDGWGTPVAALRVPPGERASGSPGSLQGRNLLGKGSIYTLGSVLQLSGAALAIPIVTRLLDPAEYGTVALALTIQLFVTTLSALGVPAALTRIYFETEEDGKATARALVMSTGLVSLGGTVLGLLTALAWAPALVPGEAGAVMLGVAIALPGALITASLALLRVQERPVSFICVALVANFGAQLLGIACLLIDRSAAAYLIGYGGAMVVAALGATVLTGAIRAGLASRRTLREAIDYGLPTVPHTLSVFILALGDRVVIQLISGLAAVGKYQLSYAVGGLGMNFLSSLQNAWVPITFGAEEHLRWKSLAETAALVTRLAALICGLIALLARPLLSIVAPSDYDPSFLAEITAVLALSSLPWATYLPRSQVLFWTKHTKPLAWITPSAAILNLALVAVLLPPFGLVGAAAATVLAIGFTAAAMDFAAGRIAHVPWHWSSEMAHYGAGAAFVALALVLPGSFAGDALRVAFAALVGLALLAVVVREVAPRRAAAAAARLKRDAPEAVASGADAPAGPMPPSPPDG